MSVIIVSTDFTFNPAFSSLIKNVVKLRIIFILSCIQSLLKEFVSSFILTKVKMFLNKDLYLENHRFIKNYINTTKFDTYIRDIIRKDHAFVFQNLLQIRIF